MASPEEVEKYKEALAKAHDIKPGPGLEILSIEATGQNQDILKISGQVRPISVALTPELQAEWRSAIEKAYPGVLHPVAMPTTHTLNISLDQGEEARALHRVVRAMHDGHCPFCGHLGPAGDFEDWKHDHWCPKCGFTITAEEAKAALATFHVFMKRNLEIFEQWRRRRQAQTQEAFNSLHQNEPSEETKP